MPKPETVPKPWVAAMVSLGAPGLGHLYAGRLGLFVLVSGAVFVLFVLSLAVSLQVPQALFVPVCLSPVLLWGASALHAYRTAAAVPAQSRSTRWIRWPLYVAIAMVLSSAYQAGVGSLGLRTFSVTSGSMENTLFPGDFIIVSNYAQSPTLGDVVVYQNPGESFSLISRVVGLPGDALSMEAGTLSVNGTRAGQPYATLSGSGDMTAPAMNWQIEYLVGDPASPASAYAPTLLNWGPLVVPNGSVFVVGDHRDLALDSRLQGPVAVSDVTGLARRIYFSRRMARIGRPIR